MSTMGVPLPVGILEVPRQEHPQITRRILPCYCFALGGHESNEMCGAHPMEMALLDYYYYY